MYYLLLMQNWDQLAKYKMGRWINTRLIVYKIIPFASQIFILNPDPRIWNEALLWSRV